MGQKSFKKKKKVKIKIRWEKKRHDSECNVCSVYKYHYFHCHNLYNLSQLATRDRQRGGNRKEKKKFQTRVHQSVGACRGQTNGGKQITRLQYCHGLVCTATGLLCSLRASMYVWMHIKKYCGYFGNEWLNGTMWFEYSIEENLLSKRKTKFFKQN